MKEGLKLLLKSYGELDEILKQEVDLGKQIAGYEHKLYEILNNIRNTKKTYKL